VKSQYKNALKRSLYGMLAQLSEKTLPWGILTGIRPTKLIYEMLEQGKDEPFIYKRMREEYLCSDSKIAMSIRIAGRELELLQRMDYRNGYLVVVLAVK
jgi:oxygen-independent coproporphyrinogen-3 oxidase